jgi:hypothetical protein
LLCQSVVMEGEMLYFKIHFISINFTCFGNTDVNIPKLESRMLGDCTVYCRNKICQDYRPFLWRMPVFLPGLTGIFRSHDQSLSFPKHWVLNVAVNSERIPFSCVSFLCQTECWLIRLQPQNTLNHSHWHKTAKTCSHTHQLTSSPVITGFCPEHQSGCLSVTPCIWPCVTEIWWLK